MKIVENTSLTTKSAMQTGGYARFTGDITSHANIQQLHQLAIKHTLPFFVIGEGTNTLFADEPIAAVIGFMKIRGVSEHDRTNTSTQITVAAGELWDDVVAWAAARNLTGIEALSLIPGTAGAAPIQNIGAYGSEFADTCVSVTVYDTSSQTERVLSKAECTFGYRTSIFKQHPGRFVVLAVTLELSTSPPPTPTYKDVQAYFGTRIPTTVTEIRDAIVHIRTKKLPDYRVVPNLGSFFKNPIIPAQQLQELQQVIPDIPHAIQVDQSVKLFAGWLIEQVGLKGKEIEGIVIHQNNALILTNPHRCSSKAIQAAALLIVKEVERTFGVTLEREPVLIA